MPNTLADLLKKLRIEHNVNKNDPILDVPLILFKPQEYSDLITLVWLYGHNWINPAIKLKPGSQLADLSRQQVTLFYEAIKMEVTQRIKISNESSSELANYQIQRSKPVAHWVNPTQVTLFASNIPLYLRLMSHRGIAKELNVLLSWINTGTVELYDELQLLLQFQEEDLSPDKIQNLVVALSQLEPFSTHPSPLREVNKRINLLQQELVSSDKDKLAPEVSYFFIRILTALSKIYPITLDALLLKLGVISPTRLNSDLKLLLQMDLKKIPSLKEQQWPELIFYVLLFMHGHAKTDPSHLYFTYSGKKTPELLKLMSQDYINNIPTPLSQDLALITPIFSEASANTITRDLKELGLDDIQPNLLALSCFENCNPLRNLFIQVWKTQGIIINTIETIALAPSKNHFILGQAICYGSDRQTFTINNHDLTLLLELIRINNARNSSMPSHASNPGLQFFSAPVESVHHLDTEFQSQSDEIKSKIQDPVLREVVSKTAITEFGFTNAINFVAIAKFVSDYGINATNQPTVPRHKLQDLIELVTDDNALDLIAEELALTKLFLDLDKVETIPQQIENLHQVIEKLAIQIKSMLDESPDKECGLNIKWLSMQKHVCVRFREMAVHKQTQIEAAHTPQNGDGYSFSM